MNNVKESYFVFMNNIEAKHNIITSLQTKQHVWVAGGGSTTMQTY